MWTKLDERKKNLLFLSMVLLMIYMAYHLSFKQTLKAISLHNELQNEQNITDVKDGSFSQLNEKNRFYIAVIKSYAVKADDRENRLWQVISDIAITNRVTIGFTPSQQIIDSLEVKERIINTQFSFKGSYFNLVMLSDSLSKLHGIGKITMLKLAVPKERKENELHLDLTLGGIVK